VQAVKTQLLTLSEYHVWAFQSLYRALLPMSEDHYRADCGLFFKSVHGTLNHLLVGDRVWFGRFAEEPYAVDGLDQELESDRNELEQALCAHSCHWRNWIDKQSAHRLDADISYTNMSGALFNNPCAATLLHVFNHASHHRGQISAAITQFGYRAPELDLINFLRSQSGAPTP
jgi:uncharacterized damage-inducible protein DinB